MTLFCYRFKYFKLSISDHFTYKQAATFELLSCEKSFKMYFTILLQNTDFVQNFFFSNIHSIITPGK